MELSTLVFSVETSALDSAIEKIEALGTAVSKVNKPMDEMALSAAKLAKAEAEAELAAVRLAKAQDTVGGSTDRAEKLLEKLKNQYFDLTSGMTKGESSILNQARAYGVAGDALKPFRDQLELIKGLTKDPFDASVGAIRSVTAELDKLNQRANLTAQGISLSNKQLDEYSRLAKEVQGKLIMDGVDPKSVEYQNRFNAELKETQADYLMIAQAASALQQVETQRNNALREAEKIQARINRENLSMMDDAVAAFRRAEQNKVDAVERTADKIRNANLSAIESAERLEKITLRMQGGMTRSEASKRVDLEGAGVAAADIERLITAEKNLLAVEKELNPTIQRTNTGLTEQAKAAAFLERELSRAQAAVSTANSDLRVSMSNKLFRYSEELKKAGLNPEEATKLMNDYRAALIAGQAKTNRHMHLEMDAQLRNLSRAVSTQMGDVAVSLAGGMNPFTVMLQQGDQLRFAFSQVDASSEQVKQSMVNAAGMIARSFIDTGKAIGGFFTGAIQSAGNAVVQLGSSLLLPTTTLQQLRNELIANNGWTTAATQVKIFDVALKAMTISAGLAVAALGGFAVLSAVAFVKAIKATDELTISLVNNAGAIGLTTDAAIGLASTLNGISTGEAVKWMGALAESGNFTAAQMLKIIPVAKDMEKYLGFAAEKVVSEFSKLEDKPLDAMMALYKSSGLVNVATLELIASAERVGDKVTASNIAIAEKVRVHAEQVEKVKDQYTALGLAVKTTTEYFNGLWGSLVGKMEKALMKPGAIEELKQELKDLKELQGDAKNDVGVQMRIKALERLFAAEKALAAQQSDTTTRTQLATAAAIKYGQENLTYTEKYKNKIAELVSVYNLVSGNETLRANVQKEMNRVTKEYLEQADKEINKNNKKTDAQKELDKIEKSFLATRKQFIKMSNDAKGAIEKETQAISNLKTLIESDKWDEFTDDQKHSIIVVAALADKHQQEAEAIKLKNKAIDEYVAKVAKQDKLLFDLLEKSGELNLEVMNQSKLLSVQTKLLGENDATRRLALKTLEIQIQKEKELYDIRNAPDDEKPGLKADIDKRYEQRMKNINKEIALDFVTQMSKQLDSAGSFDKSAGRFVEVLREAGNLTFANLINSLSKVNELLIERTKSEAAFQELKKNAPDAAAMAKIEVMQQQQQLKTYGDLASAAKGFFKQGTSGYKAMLNAEKAFRAYEMAMSTKAYAQKIWEITSIVAKQLWGDAQIVASAIGRAIASVTASNSESAANAVTAVTNQGKGDPYTAFGRIAAMVAIMAAIGFAVQGGSSSAPAPSNQGTGTVFGDMGSTDQYGNHIQGTGAKSESIANSLKILEEVNTWTMQYSNAMLQSLRNIEKQMGGVVNLVLRSGSTTLKEQAAASGLGSKVITNNGVLPDSFRGALNSAAMGEAVGALLRKIPIFDKLANALFGSKTSVTGQGIYANNTNTDLLRMGGVSAGYYTNTQTKNKFFGITTSTDYGTINQQDQEMSKQFTLILQGFVDSVKLAGPILGVALDDIDQNLKDFTITLGQIDIQGLTGEQIQEKLAAVFGAAGDNIAKQAIPGLEKFQQVGEGYLETLVRVASSVETVRTMFDSLGFAITGVGIDKAMNFIDLFGSLDDMSNSLSSYYDDFYTEQERTATATRQMTKVLADMGVSMPTTRLEYRAKIEEALAAGNDDLVAALIKLSPAIAEIIPAAEEAAQSNDDIAESLADMARTARELGIDLLYAQGKTDEAKAAFKALETEGMTPAQVAAWEYNQTLTDQIEAQKKVNDEATRLANSMKAFQTEATNLNIELMQLLGNTDGANSAIRELAIVGLTATEIAAWDANKALKDQIQTVKDQIKIQEEAAQAAKTAADAIAQAAKAEAERLESSLKSFATEQANLNIELLEAQGLTEAAKVAMRNLAISGLTPLEVAAWDTNNAIRIQIDSINEANRVAQEAAEEKLRIEEELAAKQKQIADEYYGLETQRLQLQGNEIELRDRELALLDPTNQEIQKLIWSLQDQAKVTEEATRAAEEAAAEQVRIAEELAALQKQIADERYGIETQLLTALGDNVKLRERELALLDPSNRALQEQVWAQEALNKAIEEAAKVAEAAAAEQVRIAEELAAAQQRIADERYGLETQLLQVQGNTNELRARELAALDPTNREIQLLIWSLQDQANATSEAAKVAEEAAAAQLRAAEELAAAQQRIADERYGLESRLLELQGNTAALRERELAALDPSNRALMEQIWAQEAANKAAEEAAKVAQEQAEAVQKAVEDQIKAAEELKQAWQSITDTIFEEVARIRGLTGGDSQIDFARAQSNFDLATMQARAGNQEAAASLPELSKVLLELAGSQARSLNELRRIQMLTAMSLEQTGSQLVGQYGLTVPAFASGGSYSGGLALVGETGPELINFNRGGHVSSSTATSSILGSNLEALVEKLNENIEGLRIEVRADVSHNAKTAKLLDRVIKDGETISVSFLEAQDVNVV